MTTEEKLQKLIGELEFRREVRAEFSIGMANKAEKYSSRYFAGVAEEAREEAEFIGKLLEEIQ